MARTVARPEEAGLSPAGSPTALLAGADREAAVFFFPPEGLPAADPWPRRRKLLAAALGAALLCGAAALAFRPARPPRAGRGGLEAVAAGARTFLSEAAQEALGEEVPSRLKCSAKGEACLDSGCCEDPGMHCFSKAEGWAQCKGSCIAGVHEEDPPEFREPWSCRLLGAKSAVFTALHWNVHWQCSRARLGSTGACRTRAAQRLAELALEARASAVAAIELAHDDGAPVAMKDFGLEGWAQVDGRCPGFGDYWDSVLLALAPGWKVLDSGGGCLNGRADARAFAVASVRPPRPVRGCPELCVVALHAPHMPITEGHGTVAKVCGAAARRCAVAFGDWNVPLTGGVHGGVEDRWAELVGGDAPNFMLPNWRTCCWPEWKYHGLYDHLATNVPGAHTEGRNGSTGYRVFPYQIEEEDPEEQHRPLAVWLQLPVAVGEAPAAV